MTAEDGQWRAQLVSDVVEDPPLSFESRLEAIEHLVEGVPEFGDVIMALRLQTTAEITAGDRLRGLPQLGHR